MLIPGSWAPISFLSRIAKKVILPLAVVVVVVLVVVRRTDGDVVSLGMRLGVDVTRPNSKLWCILFHRHGTVDHVGTRVLKHIERIDFLWNFEGSLLTFALPRFAKLSAFLLSIVRPSVCVAALFSLSISRRQSSIDSAECSSVTLSLWSLLSVLTSGGHLLCKKLLKYFL